ncbi:MAG: hypothetical protein PHX18_00990 [Candidatus Gastranaerophilales bacterium]|nr:hypothetical protein [Candidatus Gastranaerophilales bacterium]
MKIIPLNTCYKNSPVFGSNARGVYDETGQIVHRNTTCFFRNDLEWAQLVKLLDQKYKDVPKVNVYCYACSDGSEPYSLAMLLLEKLGPKKAEKFFPIIAVDYDAKILEQTEEGIIEGTCDDEKNINKATSNNLGAYLNQAKPSDGKNCIFKVRKELKDKVRFHTGDVHKDIDNLEQNNSVLMLRNVWPYFPGRKQAELLDKIQERLNNNSLLIIGFYDRDSGDSSGVMQAMHLRGFNRTPVKYCYEIDEKKDSLDLQLWSYCRRNLHLKFADKDWEPLQR